QRARPSSRAFAPARQVLDRERPYSRHQIRSELRDPRRQGSQVFTAELGEPFSEPGELKLPGSKLVGTHAALQQGVALLERPGIPAPYRHELLFHVEQNPIQVSPPMFRFPADQCVASGIEGDNRKRTADVADAVDHLPIQLSRPRSSGVT